MTISNSVNASQSGIQVLTTTGLVGRTITGTTNQYSVSNGDGVSGEPTVGFDTNRVLSTQPCFLAKVSGTNSNVTGNNTNYTIVYDNEVFDQGGNYNPASGVFTAPVTGKYYFCSSVTLSGLLVTHTQIYLQFASSATGNYLVRPGKLFSILGADGMITIQGSIIITMSSGNTMSNNLQISGGTQVVDVYGNNDSSWFSGYLCL